ncbi:PH domain-containing protein [Streptomyces chumphonensis]|uniref:PH domain-containing protein n=1 Tax=Streptomyces chumphonensis TaxID=1214925 RepID=UPI003D73D404
MQEQAQHGPTGEPPVPDAPDDVPRPTAAGGAAPDAPASRPTAGPPETGDQEWRGVERALLSMRRTVLLTVMGALTLATGLPLALTLGPVWALPALLWPAVAAWGWYALGRNWRSWRYAERADDLLISRGVLWRETTVVPYGRMQLVEVTSGPVERRYGLARLQLHTAAATTDAAVPGLVPAEAERLRDRLTELGEARSAGL